MVRPQGEQINRIASASCCGVTVVRIETSDKASACICLNEIPRAYFVPHSVNYIKQNGAWIIYTKSPHEDHDGRPIGDYFKRYGVEYNGPETLGRVFQF